VIVTLPILNLFISCNFDMKQPPLSLLLIVEAVALFIVRLLVLIFNFVQKTINFSFRDQSIVESVNSQFIVIDC